MTYEFYTEQPRRMIEVKMNVIPDDNPLLIKSLDRSVNHPLIRK